MFRLEGLDVTNGSALSGVFLMPGPRADGPVAEPVSEDVGPVTPMLAAAVATDDMTRLVAQEAAARHEPKPLDRFLSRWFR